MPLLPACHRAIACVLEAYIVNITCLTAPPPTALPHTSTHAHQHYHVVFIVVVWWRRSGECIEPLPSMSVGCEWDWNVLLLLLFGLMVWLSSTLVSTLLCVLLFVIRLSVLLSTNVLPQTCSELGTKLSTQLPLMMMIIMHPTAGWMRWMDGWDACSCNNWLPTPLMMMVILKMMLRMVRFKAKVDEEEEKQVERVLGQEILEQW